jgi:AbrB family looped-hinge helix DNA binding protein
MASTVRVSPKFQVVIPKEVREALGLRAGQRLVVFRHQDRIEMVPAEPIQKLRGFARGIDTDVPRDEDRV